MLNFLFGLLCAGGAVFGALLTLNGVTSETYEAVTAGGVFLFGSLLTFGIGQLTRAKSRRQKRVVRVHTPAPVEKLRRPERNEPALFPESSRPAVFPVAAREQPAPVREEPPLAAHNPGLERVASRFARAAGDREDMAVGGR